MLREARCRQSGFTLLEMVVVLAVVGVSLLLAAALLQEARALIQAAGAELTSPINGLATDRLRADLQEAAAVLSPPPPSLDGWTGEPLLLEAGGEGGLAIAYQREGRELVRRLLRDDGSEAVREVWLRDLARWRWRASAPNLVEIDLAYHRVPPASRQRLDGGPGKPAPELAVARLLATLRGGGRGRGW